MSTSGPDDLLTIDQLCPQCHAGLRADAARCWLCGANIRHDGKTEITTPVLAAPRPGAVAERSDGFSLASLMMFVTLVSVALGVSTIAPGVGIPLGIVLLVVWLRTAAVAQHRAVRGIVTTRAERIQLFFTSFGVTLAMIVLTCVGGAAALMAALFSICAHDGVSSASARSNADAEMILFALLALAIAVLTIWWVVRVTRRRWRRDTGEVQSLDTLTWVLVAMTGIIAVIAVVGFLFSFLGHW
jgi:hypothetical protein